MVENLCPKISLPPIQSPSPHQPQCVNNGPSYSNATLNHPCSMMFQYVKLSDSITNALNRPDDQAEWRNIFQLMYHMRQALACAMCGKLVSNPYTPVRDSCHCVCATCREGNLPMSYNCVTCRHAQASQDGFIENSEFNYTAVGFAKFCKLLYVKGMVQRWSNLTVPSQSGPLTFAELILEGKDAGYAASEHCLGESFKKAKVKQKRRPCRCGSGKSNRPGNLTCLGQRCACYKEGKGCDNCRCIGCKNPNGMSSRSSDDQHKPLD